EVLLKPDRVAETNGVALSRLGLHDDAAEITFVGHLGLDPSVEPVRETHDRRGCGLVHGDPPGSGTGTRVIPASAFSNSASVIGHAGTISWWWEFRPRWTTRSSTGMGPTRKAPP